jgi:hypothetical protein
MLANVGNRPWLTLTGLASYLSVLLIHEIGHLIAAQRLGCRVNSIKLYPVFGVTCFEIPWTRLDHCVIAWGGVVAQAIVAIPRLMDLGVWIYANPVSQRDLCDLGILQSGSRSDQPAADIAS